LWTTKGLLPDYLIYLDVTDLKVYGGMEPKDVVEGKGVIPSALRGLANLEGRDKSIRRRRLRRRQEPADRILPADGRRRRDPWNANISYNMYDLEIETSPGSGCKASAPPRSSTASWMRAQRPTDEAVRRSAAPRLESVNQPEAHSTDDSFWPEERWIPAAGALIDASVPGRIHFETAFRLMRPYRAQSF
jgi:hypothetical protein